MSTRQALSSPQRFGWNSAAAYLKEKNKGNQGLSIWLHEGLFKDLRAKREALQGKWNIVMTKIDRKSVV